MATSALFFGYAIGALFVTPLADRYGRRTIGKKASVVLFQEQNPSALISICFIIAVGVIAAFSVNYWMFFVCRFLCGIAMAVRMERERVQKGIF